ncbi:hypothetical protein SD70_02345 [Gordoniibacillus kamchatkensis]|uniref:Accessory regulator AgrB n=1 Tax=Gordoniibacillus kamchatkensis TaxID=1590651 RepID=A0ABR5AM07_9BACL|nr:accessory gene regulator B family protein [Paenibacillus sp. VKM B-2647]KIL42046.1 hypothetical protein SD70_02345 [Paenibacillus sp. VKM B-2647]
MIENAAHWLAARIKRANPEETTSVEIMRFSLIILINAISIFLFSSLVGFLTGKLVDTLIVFVLMCVLRFLSGGHHLSTPTGCIALSTIVVSLVPHIHITSMLVMVFNGISLLLILFLAPAGLEGHTRVPKEYYPLFKGISALMVLSNFWFRIDLFAIAFFIQALSLIPFRKGGE